eukprot:scaffold13142_cov79-Skeletonema_menzelii.AAC.2
MIPYKPLVLSYVSRFKIEVASPNLAFAAVHFNRSWIEEDRSRSLCGGMTGLFSGGQMTNPQPQLSITATKKRKS